MRIFIYTRIFTLFYINYTRTINSYSLPFGEIPIRLVQVENKKQKTAEPIEKQDPYLNEVQNVGMRLATGWTIEGSQFESR
jgi:hypothetical protein